MVSNKRVGHGGHSYKGEQGCRNAADTVTKVKETYSKASKNDSEVEPRKECTFIGEENFGLDTRWKSNSLA